MHQLLLLLLLLLLLTSANNCATEKDGGGAAVSAAAQPPNVFPFSISAYPSHYAFRYVALLLFDDIMLNHRYCAAGVMPVMPVQAYHACVV